MEEGRGRQSNLLVKKYATVSGGKAYDSRKHSSNVGKVISDKYVCLLSSCSHQVHGSMKYKYNNV